MKDFRTKRWIIVSVLILALVFICFYVAYRCHYFKDSYTLAKLDCGDGHRIVISAKYISRETRSFHCQIFKKGNEIVPHTWIDVDNYTIVDKMRFRLITSKDGQITGIVNEKYPNVVYVIYEFSSGKLWTYTSVTEYPELLNHLATDYPEIM